MRHSAAHRKSGAGKIEITASGQIQRVSHLLETTRSAGRHSHPCRHPSLSKTPQRLPCSRQGVRRFEAHLPLFDTQLPYRPSIDRPSRRRRSEQSTGLTRHENSLSRNVRSFAPDSHRFVRTCAPGSVVPKRSGAAGQGPIGHSATSSVHTLKPTSVFGPNVWVIGTSQASRPWAIRMRPIRGSLLRGSKVCQRPPI
jgi:hypothetical protein